MQALLRCASHFSFLHGTMSPRTLCERAVRNEILHVALCDWGGLYGVPEFALEADRVGLHAIFGVELGTGAERLCALARDETGFRSLCRLVSDYRRGDVAPALVALAAEHQAGLFVLCDRVAMLDELASRFDHDCLRVALPPLATPREPATGALALPADAAPRRLVESPDSRKVPDPTPRPDRRRLLHAAERHGLTCVAAPWVVYATPEERAAHRLAVAARKGRIVDRVREDELAWPGSYLLPARQLGEAYADLPEVVAETMRVARACTLSLAKPRPLVLPKIAGTGLHGEERATELLRTRAEAGLFRLYGRGTTAAERAHFERARQRLDYELRVVGELGFCDYFLVVEEIVVLARDRGIPCLGRGSAADSLIAHCLGFTDADPLRYGLCFERFLNPERFKRDGRALPDIDLDFCWRRRDELLELVCNRFGDGRVALLGTQPSFGFRAAYREAARALGLPLDEVDRRSRGLPRKIDDDLVARGRAGDYRMLPKLLERSPEFRARLSKLAGGAEERAREARIWWGAFALTGMQRYLGLHPGGTVLGPVPLRDIAPVERAAKGLPALQWDKHVAPHMGLVKIDLLGNRGLSTFADARRELVRLGASLDQVGGDVDVDVLAPTPDTDPQTAELLRAGRTIGCWQIESPGMRRLLTRIAAQNLDDVIQTVALIRPGPAGSGMMNHYVKRARGEEAVPELPPELMAVLGPSRGVMLYQEDSIHVLAELCGLDLAAGDLLRRAVGSGSYYHHVKHGDPHADLVDAKQFFFTKTRERGIPKPLAESFWTQVERFSRFSFCKAHAVTYGRLAWRLVRIKAREPAAVLAAILANDTGYYQKRVYVEEAKRCGVPVLPPCVNRSAIDFRTERPGSLGKSSIRTGLGEVRELPLDFVEGLLHDRDERGPFFSVDDLVLRLTERGLSVEDRAIEHLILVGAFDLLEGTRPEKLWRFRIEAGRRRRVGADEYMKRRSGRGVLFSDALLDKAPVIPCLPEFDDEERARVETELLGFTTGLHPLDLLPAQAGGFLELADVPAHIGKDVAVVGWLAAMRRHRTRRGDWMCFLTLEDKTGICEAVVFPDCYRRYGGKITGQGRYIVRGRVETDQGAVALHATSLESSDE